MTSHDDPLERWAVVAWSATVVTAVIAAVVWISTLILFDPVEWSQLLLGILTIVMIVGGAVMGVLYIARLARRRGDGTG